jgi:hypothetical protein
MDMTLPTLTPQVGDSMQMLLARLTMGAYRRSNVQAPGLASAARTATTQSTDISCIGFGGIIVTLNVTVASGTGGLKVRIRYKDSVTGIYYVLSESTLIVTATGGWVYQHAPGTGTTVTAILGNLGSAAGLLTDTIRIEIIHGDASSYTYSVNYVLVP